MGIFSFLFGDSKKLPFNKTIRFEKKSDFSINIGDELNLWNKPNTSQLYLYIKGSTGNSGLAGVTKNSTISYHLEETDNLFIENEVVALTSNSIHLLINMFTDEKAVEKMQQNYQTEWIEKLNKKYTPRTSWELRFYSKLKISKNDLLIKTIDKSQILEYYQKENDAIWLTNLKNEKLPAENYIRSGGAEKTLRAVFSGHEIKILTFKKESNWYYLEVGI